MSSWVRSRASEIIVGVVANAAIAVAGIASGWSLGWIVLSLVIGATCSVWLYYGWLRIQNWRFRPINAEKWSRVDLPALWQAACILDDIEPYVPLREGTPCYATLQMLKSSIMQGDLEVEGEFGGTDTWQRIHSDDLREYAADRGMSPKALVLHEN